MQTIQLNEQMPDLLPDCASSLGLTSPLLSLAAHRCGTCLMVVQLKLLLRDIRTCVSCAWRRCSASTPGAGLNILSSAIQLCKSSHDQISDAYLPLSPVAGAIPFHITLIPMD